MLLVLERRFVQANRTLLIVLLAAMVVAVRQALDYAGTGRALVVCGIGLLAYLGVNVAIGAVFGAIQALLGAVSVPV